MSVIEHQPDERPSADSPSFGEYYILECDQCGERWEVRLKAEDVLLDRHLCAKCEKEVEDVR